MHKYLIAGPTYKDMQAPKASIDYPVHQMFLDCGRKRKKRENLPWAPGDSNPAPSPCELRVLTAAHPIVTTLY